MAKIRTTKSMYSTFQSENNLIGDRGCKYLSRVNFKKIYSIDLGNIINNEGNNNIGDAGALHLSKAKWKTI